MYLYYLTLGSLCISTVIIYCSRQIFVNEKEEEKSEIRERERERERDP